MQTREKEKYYHYENNLTLIDAAKKNQSKIVQMLLKRGADRSFKSTDKLTAIEVAAIKQSWDCVLEFANYKADNTVAEYYNNALLMAVQCNQFNVAYALLLADAKPTSRLKKTGDGCLHLAVQNNNPGMIDLLYRFGANFEAINKDKLTPQGLARQLDRYKNCIPAFIAKQDFEDERDTFVLKLEEYAKRLTSFHRKRATSLAVACMYKAKSTKELIALLELQIDLFKPEYTILLPKAEIKKLPFHERQPVRRKDEFNQIIAKHHDILMQKVLEEELRMDIQEKKNDQMIQVKDNNLNKEINPLRQFSLLNDKEKNLEKKNLVPEAKHVTALLSP